MAALETPNANIGWKALDFRLKNIDGKEYSMKDLRGVKGTVIMFICNHCPYVKAILDKIIRDANELKEHGINFIAVNSNDTGNYPEDSWDNMVKLAKEKNFPFPYMFDETQKVAKAYGAVCTPDFFGFNELLQLQYRGRLDDSKMNSNNPKAPRELFDAMMQIAKTGKYKGRTTPSIGCSIKWKSEAA